MAYSLAEIKRVACSGAGVIGSSFAASFALAGYPTNVYEINGECVARAHAAVDGVFDSMVQLGYASAESVAQARTLLHYTDDPAQAFAGVQFIQENGPERLEVKRDIVAMLDRYAEPDAIICSSTSGMKISDIARDSAHPGRYLGAHPYNPPHLIPLVEMSFWREVTPPQVLETGKAFYQHIGKEPVVMRKERPGFIANRLAIAVWREQIAMVMDGVCTLEDADKAMCFGPGLRYAIYGPGMIYHLSGPGGLRAADRFRDTANSVMESLSDMQEVPKEWPEISGDQIEVEIANMPDFKGHTSEELAAYRDRCLVELLRMHGKVK